MISIGGIIGAGFFIGASGPISMAGPGVIVTYAFSGLLTIFESLMLRDIALNSVEPGSFIMSLRSILGRSLGFIAGWTYWIIWVVTLAIEVIGASDLIREWIHIPFTLIELIVLSIVTGANLVSVRNYGEVEYWLSIIKIMALVSFILISLGSLFLGIHAMENMHSASGFLPNGLTALFAAAPTVVYSMSGSEVATIAALESGDPRGNASRLSRVVALSVTSLYFFSIVALLSLVSWDKIMPGQSPFLYALNIIHMPFASTVMTIIILTSMLSTLNSGIYATSRITFEMAEVGDALASFKKLDVRNNLPVRAILLCSLGTLLVAILAIISPNLVFAFLASASGAMIILHYGLITTARVILSKKNLWKAWVTFILLLVVIVSMVIIPSARYELVAGILAFFIVGVAEKITRARRKKWCAFSR
ncbi:amino acid/polyamine transporter [Neokomagataea thailandica NBRC 106555]|nr:amino acid/polyamine transporter [Neokomagataea thailandica NBRC 106555]